MLHCAYICSLNSSEQDEHLKWYRWLAEASSQQLNLSIERTSCRSSALSGALPVEAWLLTRSKTCLVLRRLSLRWVSCLIEGFRRYYLRSKISRGCLREIPHHLRPYQFCSSYRVSSWAFYTQILDQILFTNRFCITWHSSPALVKVMVKIAKQKPLEVLREQQRVCWSQRKS